MTSNDSGNDLRSRIARPGIATLLLIGLIAMALVGAGCGGDDNADTGGGATGETAEQVQEKADEAKDKAAAEIDEEAKENFTSTCGSCHTLADAGTSGTTGPNLDDLKPTTARVLAAIKNGGASGTSMPKNLLEGAEAANVAQYVSSVAGK